MGSSVSKSDAKSISVLELRPYVNQALYWGGLAQIAAASAFLFLVVGSPAASLLLAFSGLTSCMFSFFCRRPLVYVKGEYIYFYRPLRKVASQPLAAISRVTEENGCLVFYEGERIVFSYASRAVSKSATQILNDFQLIGIVPKNG